MGLLYYLFHHHHWTPEMYADLGEGARDLTWALALHEAEMEQERKDRRP